MLFILKPPRFGAHLHDGDRWRVIKKDASTVEICNGQGQLAPVLLAEDALAQQVSVNSSLRAEQPLSQLLLAHFEGKDSDNRA